MPLNNLPAEILAQILSHADSLADLDSLARASRRLYALFRSDQPALIYRALAAELGPGLLPEALGLSLVQVLDADAEGFITQLRTAVARYGRCLLGFGGGVGVSGEGGSEEDDGGVKRLGGSGMDGLPSPRQLPLDDVLRLVRWYRAAAYIAQLYGTCSLGLFKREVVPTCPPSSLGDADDDPSSVLLAPLSRTERVRILRAFYRLQMFLLVWCSLKGRHHLYNDIAHGAIAALAGHWELWEVQEVFCAGAFYSKFRRGLARVYLGTVQHPRAAELLTSACDFEEFRAWVREVRAGNEVAWQKTLKGATSFQYGPENAGAYDEQEVNWYRRRVHNSYSLTPLSERPERHKYPAKLCFNEDCAHSAPFGWVDAFDGNCDYDLWSASELRSRAQPTERLWSCMGFVFWDVSRVRALKASSLLSGCKTGWARLESNA